MPSLSLFSVFVLLSFASSTNAFRVAEVDFISDDDYKMETEENNKSFVDISECLKLRDNRNSNKYNLQNMYLSEKYSYE